MGAHHAGPSDTASGIRSGPAYARGAASAPARTGQAGRAAVWGNVCGEARVLVCARMYVHMHGHACTEGGHEGHAHACMRASATNCECGNAR